MKPKIFLSASNTKSLINYTNAIEISGGVPHAYFNEAPDISDYSALLLCGGGDIAPEYYGQINNGSYDIDRKRDLAEFRLIEKFVSANKPIFGICRGHQVINVFFGGTLIQDLELASFHRALESGDRIHNVYTKPGSILSRVYGRKLLTNSAHHQGIDKTGEGLMATATWKNNVNEAIEHIKLPLFSVQWHPERITKNEVDRGCAEGKKLFDYLISIC